MYIDVSRCPSVTMICTCCNANIPTKQKMDANLKDILTENHESPSLHRLMYGNSISTRVKYNIIIILEGGDCTIRSGFRINSEKCKKAIEG